MILLSVINMPVAIRLFLFLSCYEAETSRVIDLPICNFAEAEGKKKKVEMEQGSL